MVFGFNFPNLTILVGKKMEKNSAFKKKCQKQKHLPKKMKKKIQRKKVTHNE
jgi:hypothetical protein